MPTDPQDEAAARWVVDRHAPDGPFMVRVYPGNAKVATEAFAQAARKMGEDVVSVTWADGAIVAVYRKPVANDALPAIFGIVGFLLFIFAGYQLVTMRSVSGDSLAEEFYHAVGWLSWGLAALSMAVGLRRG